MARSRANTSSSASVFLLARPRHGLRLPATGQGDIDVIVVTHGHPDHIGGLVEGGKPVFPNARYVFGAARVRFLEARRKCPRKRASSTANCS